MTYSNVIHTLLLTQFSTENSWVKDITNVIVHPLVSLVLTCIIFLGFLYQLYSKNKYDWYLSIIIVINFVSRFSY